MDELDELFEVVNNDSIGHTHDDEDPVLKMMSNILMKRFVGSTMTKENIDFINAKKKKFPQACGVFWQKRFGTFPGWEDLKTGHESGCDLRNEDLGIIMELKNKYNTMNSTNMNATIEKLKRQEGYKRRIIGIVNGKGNDIRVVGGGMVEIIQGRELFRLVTGNPEYMSVFLKEAESRDDYVVSDIPHAVCTNRYGDHLEALLSRVCRDFGTKLINSWESGTLIHKNVDGFVIEAVNNFFKPMKTHTFHKKKVHDFKIDIRS
jgi:hypothetical protein